MEKSNSNLSFILLERYGVAAFFLVVSVVFGLLNPSFFAVENLVNILVQSVPLGIVAIGFMFVISAGGMDLTVGAAVTVAVVFMEFIFRDVFVGNMPLTILSMFVLALLIGVINGFLVAVVKLSSVIVTLIMMTILNAVVFVILRSGDTIKLTSPIFDFIARDSILGIPVAVVIMAAVFFAAFVMLNHSKLGRYLIAIGNSESVVRAAGINIHKYIFFSYLISAACVGIAATVLIARVSFAGPGIGGVSILLDSLAAIIIGGISIFGGKSTVRGVVFGILIISVVNNMILLSGISPLWNDFFKGALILLIMIFNMQIAKALDRRYRSV